MRKALIISIFSICFFAINAQSPQVSGIVSSKTTGEAIQGAIVMDSAGFIYTYTNSNGYFNLGFGGGKYTIVVSANGYKRQIFHMDVFGLRDLDVMMVPLTEMTNDTFSNKISGINDYRSGHSTPLIKQVQNMPSLLNEQDLVKYLQFLPGVNGGIEGLSGLYVRGGNSDQNLVMMDGLPVYGNGRLFGFLSGFNTDIVRDMQLYRGVAPARYGGRAGAVLDANMIDGNKNEWKGNFTGNPLVFRLNMDGPISEKVTASFGVRRSWLDLFLPHSGGNYVFYNLHDLNAKVVYSPDKNNKISFWAYNGRDKFGMKFTDTERDSTNRLISLKLEQSLTWQNTLAGVNFMHRFQPNHYAVFTVGMSRYAYKSDLKLEGSVTSDTGTDFAAIKFNNNNSITDFIAKADLEYTLNSGNYLRYGGEIINHNFKPSVETFGFASGTDPMVDSTFGKVNIQDAQEGSAYAEWEGILGPGLKINAGGRLWYFQGKEKSFLNPEPRIMLSQLLHGQRALKLGFSIANQGVNQLASVNASLPGNIWFPSSRNIQQQQNIQITAGYYRPFKKGIEFTLDGYYKIMKGLTEMVSGDDGDKPKNYWEKMLAQGNGNAYGMEAMLMKKHGRLSGLMSYTLSFSNRTIPDVNFGNKYPFRWDRRHKGTITGVYQVSSQFMINFSLVVMSGYAVSVPTGKYVAADGTFIFDYSAKNNFRMPLYRRIDFGFAKEIRPNKLKKEKQFWGMNIYNVLNNFNPLFISLEKDKNNVLKAVGTSYFPFVPSIYYKWEF